jgi:membrane peptidoglycan carboxypeptidase
MTLWRRVSCVLPRVQLPAFPRGHRKVLAGRPVLLTCLIVALAVVSFFAAGVAAWFSFDITAGLPKRDAIGGLGDMAQATTLFDAHDRHAFTIFKEQRIELPLAKMSPNLIKAVISVEDQRFYDHSGVDAIRVAGAVLRNLEAGRRAEGGSTITQSSRGRAFSAGTRRIAASSRRSFSRAISKASIRRTTSSRCT